MVDSASLEGDAETELNLTLLRFQKYLLLQFGFMKCNLDRSYADMRHNNQKSDRLLFVHSSGNIFVLIPKNKTLEQVNNVTNYFARSIASNNNLLNILFTLQTGFLWSCNYMVSKRWRTSSTPVLGDESYVQSVLKEFKDCCKNYENRLISTWQSFRDLQ